MAKQDGPKEPRRVNEIPKGFEFRRINELGHKVYGVATSKPGYNDDETPKPKAVITPVKTNSGNPNNARPPRIVPKFRDKLPKITDDEVTMFNDEPKPEIKSADSPLYGSVDIHRQIDPTNSNQHYTAYRYTDANGNYTNKATTRYFEAKPSNGQDAQELNNDLTKSFDAKGNFVPSVVPNSYLNSGANVGGISRIMSPKDSGVNKMAEGQVNNFTLPGVMHTKNSGSGGTAIVKGASGIQNNVAGNSDAFIPKKYDDKGVEIPQANTGIQDINAPKLPAKEVGKMYQTMPKFKKGGTVKGYFNGTPPGGVEGEYNPDQPISGQGIIQPNGATFTPTGNATNNQGQQSSQVNQGDKGKGNGMLNASSISGYAGTATALAASLGANKQLRGEQKRKADAGAVNGAVDSTLSSIPVGGQYYAAGLAASSLAKSALPTDSNGNVQGKDNEVLNNLFTPLHTTVINDVSKGNYGDALLNTLSMGASGRLNDYLSYDDRQKQKEADKQAKLDVYRKQNTESKIKQAMANRDAGNFGGQTKDVYDINSAKFDSGGNLQSINPTGYKGGGLVSKIKQMCAEGGSIKPTITNDKVMEVAMSGKGYDTLNKYDKQRVDSMKQHMSSQGNKDMITFPKMIQGKADGGKIEGKGTGKSDSIHAKVEEGSFVVPAENADLAKGIRKLYLKVPNKKANVNQKEGEEVKLSNGEHLFTPEENEYLESIGVNLESLAPNAEKEEDGKAKGGKIKSYGDGGKIKVGSKVKSSQSDTGFLTWDGQKWISNNLTLNEKGQSDFTNQYFEEQKKDFATKLPSLQNHYDYIKNNPDRKKEADDLLNEINDKQSFINGKDNASNNPSTNKTTAITNNPSQSLRAPKVNKSKSNGYTPPQVADNGAGDEVVVPGDKLSPNERAKVTASEDKRNADAKALNASLPQTLPTTYANNKRKGSGILSALGNIDPTMAIGPMQTSMGINMLQGSTLPIDKAVLDATYNGNVNRAQGQAGYGYTPEQMAMLNNENQNSLSDARFSARNFAGGNASTAFNQERQAINQGWANKLGLTSADQQLRMQKQQYADEQVANRANTLSANRRQAYLDALGAFQQKQQAGSELIGAGLQNTIGVYRYNKELNNENQADSERNRWTSEIGKTNV